MELSRYCIVNPGRFSRNEESALINFDKLKVRVLVETTPDGTTVEIVATTSLQWFRLCVPVTEPPWCTRIDATDAVRALVEMGRPVPDELRAAAESLELN